MFCGRNHDWVMSRYLGWSGASICTRVRTRCGLPPVIERTIRSPSMVVKVVGMSPEWNRSFCRLISRMSACLVTSQKG
jgi:hypothetical protein